MISTQRCTGSLLGEMRSRTPSCSTSAAVPGVEPKPGIAQALEHGAGMESRDVAHVGHLHRRVGVQVDLGRQFLCESQPALVVLKAPIGVDARLHAYLGRAEIHGLLHPPRELRLRVLVGVGRATALAKATERAADHAHVGDVDVAVDDERHGVAGQLGAQLVGGQPHLLDDRRAPLGEQRSRFRRVVRAAPSRALADGVRRGILGHRDIAPAARPAARDERPVVALDDVEHPL